MTIPSHTGPDSPRPRHGDPELVRGSVLKYQHSVGVETKQCLFQSRLTGDLKGHQKYKHKGMIFACD